MGIAHPLHLSEDVRAAWGQLLADYELIPTFPQLGRPVYTLEDGDADQSEITRFKDRKVPAVSFVGTLDRLHWVRGIPADGGVFSEHSKPFYGANITAIVEYYGVPVGYMEGWDDQSVESCFFVPGIYDPQMYARHEKKLRLGEVDPVVISEVLSDLHTVAAKGK